MAEGLGGIELLTRVLGASTGSRGIEQDGLMDLGVGRGRGIGRVGVMDLGAGRNEGSSESESWIQASDGPRHFERRRWMTKGSSEMDSWT